MTAEHRVFIRERRRVIPRPRWFKRSRVDRIAVVELGRWSRYPQADALSALFAKNKFPNIGLP